ncbi:MAG TPA: L,D-transpeptidase [Xanthobacteraceae bacterium]
MLSSRGLAVGAALMTGLIAYADTASAQDCDERYDRGCRGYYRPPPPPPIFPFFLFPQPREPAPYARPDGPGPYAQPGPPREPAPYGRPPVQAMPMRPGDMDRPIDRPMDPGIRRDTAALYASIAGEPFPIAAVNLSEIGAEFLRAPVGYPTNELPGTIIIDPRNHFLYFIQSGGRAIRYGVGVGREGFGWSGVATIHDKQEWPDWYPPKEMLARQPELRRQMSGLEDGIGMPGGPRNPLGSRAMYLWQGERDTLYRIHGTVEPWTIGKSVSSGCIRMINQDVMDLYSRALLGAKVVVLP